MLSSPQMAFSLFPAFYDHPTGIQFADQEDDEVIELFLRQHWVTNVSWIFLTVVGFLLPLVVFSQPIIVTFVRSLQIPSEILLSSLILWYVFILAYAIERVMHWYFNIYILTNQHLVDVNFHNLMSRDKVEVRLDDVQSVKSHVIGILGSLFHFGDLIIETAAERQNLSFTAVPKPDFVAERIQDLQEAQEGPPDVT